MRESVGVSSKLSPIHISARNRGSQDPLHADRLVDEVGGRIMVSLKFDFIINYFLERENFSASFFESITTINNFTGNHRNCRLRQSTITTYATAKQQHTRFQFKSPQTPVGQQEWIAAPKVQRNIVTLRSKTLRRSLKQYKM